MATVIEADEGMSVGRVFSRGFGVIADNPVTVLGIAFLFGAVPSVLISWLQQSVAATAMDRFQTIGSFGLGVASMLVSLVIQALVQGSLVDDRACDCCPRIPRASRARFGRAVA